MLTGQAFGRSVLLTDIQHDTSVLEDPCTGTATTMQV